MSIKESSANALVRFTGMGIISFDKENGCGEISIIRDKKHTFSVRIQEPRFKDGVEKDLIIYEDIAVYDSLPKEEVEVAINAVSDAKVAGYEIYNANGEFDRLKSEDVNDFRWIVDLDDLHTNKVSKMNGKDNHPTAIVSIKNGHFYTHKLDTNLFFEKITKDKDGKEEKRETFGNVAETIGVKIEAEKLEFRIKIGEKEESHVLENRGIPYRIEINNIDHNENSDISDMPEYYKYLKSQSGKTYELEPLKEDEDGNLVSGGSYNDLAFCHPVSHGGG